jgi:hypothetical protein
LRKRGGCAYAHSASNAYGVVAHAQFAPSELMLCFSRFGPPAPVSGFTLWDNIQKAPSTLSRTSGVHTDASPHRQNPSEKVALHKQTDLQAPTCVSYSGASGGPLTMLHPIGPHTCAKQHHGASIQKLASHY